MQRAGAREVKADTPDVEGPITPPALATDAVQADASWGAGGRGGEKRGIDVSLEPAQKELGPHSCGHPCKIRTDDAKAIGSAQAG